MEKLTAEFLASLPEDEQREIIGQFGAENLNNIHVTKIDLDNKSQTEAAVQAMLNSFDKHEALTHIITLVGAIIDQDFPVNEIKGMDRQQAIMSILSSLHNAYVLTQE